MGIVKGYMNENEVVAFTPLRTLMSPYHAINSLSTGSLAAASAAPTDRPSVLGK
jgi:hypothetical protein